ncbi:ABC transporter permease/M1 family aminopeptidase [Armatimonas rosea]|uniref:ABC-type transport system involved in multi-copper enzyme maturation permease subunit n=1 Tax=Armatimonas rosea TaxID=685828 RepID=A0A7W9W6S4_ARMRO|nr:ABC transporter permease [Armatimonas rosea]MBB6051739.1 ABC-type transport system involved in multi-copper enzyme maturation permease subunit [Armatimonas rosea]
MLTVLKQELLLRSRQASTWGQFLFILIAAAGYLASQRNDSELGRGLVNAPVSLVTISGIFCLLVGPIVAAIAGTGILRDYELRVHELFFTSRLKPLQYYFGRFLGSFVVVAALFLALPLGLWLGTHLPGDTSHVGPFRLAPYLFCYGVVLLPNLLLTSALFFVCGALTRSLFAVYAIGVSLFVCYGIGAMLALGIKNRAAAAILDPYGLTMLSLETQYWSPAQKNTQLPALDGSLLLNRCLWAGLGLAVLLLGSALFRFRAQGPARRQRGSMRRERPTPPPTTPIPRVVPRPSALRSFVHLVRFTTQQLVTSWPFWVFFVLGLIVFFTSVNKEDSLLGTALRPTTVRMLTEVGDLFSVLYVIVGVIYVGELCWQDRLLRVAPLIDALPLSRATVTLARFVALLGAILLMGVFFCGLAMLLQVAHGIVPEPRAYLLGVLGAHGVTLVCLLSIALCLHSIAPNKFLGHVLFLVATFIPSLAELLELEHPLLDFGSVGEWHYSDLDGFSAFAPQLLGLGGHWLLVSALLLTLTLRLGRRVIVPFGALVAASTAVLLYNFHGVHRFTNAALENRERADYERLYGPRWREAPQPRITAADLDITLWPERRAFRLAGQYTLKNTTQKPLTELFIGYDSTLAVEKLALGPTAQRLENNTRLGVQIWRLAAPLAPGQELTLAFSLLWDKPGFAATGARIDIAENGTFLKNLAPRMGYQRDAELSRAADRKKQSLKARPRLPDALAIQRSYIASDADLVDLTTTVRTAPNQRALAPGKLQREWSEGGRRCFRYVTERPIRYFWAVVSGRYLERTVTWKNIPITVYYDPHHPWNVERMLRGAQDTLAFCSKSYGPYPFAQLRIVEFPARGEAIAAQAFAGTVPFSEEGGFIHQVEPDALDIPFFVTAHEVAHQWWGHQVTGAELPGAELLAESLAEYTAIRVAEEAGFSAQEVLERSSDQYLKGRGKDTDEEQALVTAQGQAYISYPKGALAFHALHWLAGKHLERFLRNYVRVLAFRGAPYPTAENLVLNLEENLPGDRQRIDELFRQIVLCDVAVVSAQCQPVPGTRRWKTQLTVTAQKVRADGQGNEKPAPLHDSIAVALDGGSASETQFIALSQPRQTVTLETPFRPTSVLLDPGYHLFDRVRENNRGTVE